MDKKLLSILVCPVTRQSLSLLDSARLERLNAQIEKDGVQFGEHAQTRALREVLITQDGKRLYRVDDGIPVLLPEEALEVATISALA